MLRYGAYRYLFVKMQQTKIAVIKFSSLYPAETVYEGSLKIISMLQVSSHAFEPTFIILVPIGRKLSDQLK
jgi:hypothetical protein